PLSLEGLDQRYVVLVPCDENGDIVVPTEGVREHVGCKGDVDSFRLGTFGLTENAWRLDAGLLERGFNVLDCWMVALSGSVVVSPENGAIRNDSVIAE